MNPEMHRRRPEKIRRLLVLALFSTGFATLVIASGMTPGDPAPPLGFEHVVQGCPDEVNWDTLAGKTVVLEFWATWCGPCVQDLPRVNRLVDELRNEDVVFLAATDESVDEVEAFLASHPMRACVVIDGDGSVFETYGIAARPSAVVIDPSRRVRMFGHSSRLSGSLIRDVIAGREVDNGPRDPSEAQPAEDPIYEVWIHPAATNVLAMSGGSGSFRGTALSAQQLFAQALNVHSARLIFEENLPEFLYDTRVIVNPASDWRRSLLAALQTTFGVSAVSEERTVEVYVVTSFTPSAKAVQAGYTNIHGSEKGLSGIGSIGSVASVLEGVLGVPVLDESGVSGEYEWAVEWGTPESVGAVLAEQGVIVKRELRTLSMFVVGSTHSK